MSSHRAFDHSDSVLKERCAEFEVVTKNLSPRGETVDSELIRYAQGLESCFKADVYVSSRSHRYLDAKWNKVKRSDRIVVLRDPTYQPR